MQTARIMKLYIFLFQLSGRKSNNIDTKGRFSGSDKTEENVSPFVAMVFACFYITKQSNNFSSMGGKENIFCVLPIFPR
jgi:hypothetical protein